MKTNLICEMIQHWEDVIEADPVLKMVQSFDRRSRTCYARANLVREDSKSYYLNLARKNARSAAKWMARWRSENPTAPHPFMELERAKFDANQRNDGKSI